MATKVIFKRNIITRQWRWKIVANNGKTISASSENFYNKKDCEHNLVITGKAIGEHLKSNQ